jgi:6-phosphofructokinase
VKDVISIVVGGGSAPGINGVISSAVIEAINEGKQVPGVKVGFKTLFCADFFLRRSFETCSLFFYGRPGIGKDEGATG